MRACTLPLSLLLLTLFFSSAQAFQVKGMEAPESFIVDPSTGVYYVSNISGEGGEKDNNAFIAKIDPTGKLVDRDFIRSEKNGVHLNAPKGLAISGKNLYVTDIDVVRRFDLESGKPLGTIDFSILGAKFLNDLAAGPDGLLFTSDSSGNTIYRIDTANNFQVTVLAKGKDLGIPNGLVYEAPHKRLLVATWETGKILGVDMQGKIIPVYKGSFKHLDGIDLDRHGNIIVSSLKKEERWFFERWFSKTGKIYRIKNYSTVEVIKKGMVTPADISYDLRNHQVLVPSLKGNLVFTIPLK
jgi:DNA-binding beta-propeller fold protein YncE